MPAQYDFRDGILLEKVVYKDESCDCGGGWLFVVCLLVTWIWGVGWFSLFFYCYINHEKTTMWVFICCWIIHMAIVVAVGALTLYKSKKAKIEKKEAKRKAEEEQKLIEESRKKRNMQHRKVTTDSNYINNNGDYVNQKDIELEEFRKNELIDGNNKGIENSDRNLKEVNTNRPLFD